MTEDQDERLVVSFERIAKALEGFNEEIGRAGKRFWPEAREQKQAVVSRVETDDERDRRLQGSRRRTIAEVVDPEAEEEPEEFLGERERQWRRDHPAEKGKEPDASTEALIAKQGRKSRTSSETSEDKG